MKRAIVTTLLASGLLLANSSASKSANSDNPKLSGNQKQALETQSPRVKVSKHHKSQDRVVTSKHTINAYVREGK